MIVSHDTIMKPPYEISSLVLELVASLSKSGTIAFSSRFNQMLLKTAPLI